MQLIMFMGPQRYQQDAETHTTGFVHVFSFNPHNNKQSGLILAQSHTPQRWQDGHVKWDLPDSKQQAVSSLQCQGP